MKKPLPISFMLLLTISAAAFAQSKDSSDWMFVLNAGAAQISAVEDEEGLYKVRLENVSPQVLVFSERQNKEVDAVSIDKFVSAWNDKAKKIKKNPPHAAIDPLSDGDAEDPVYLLEMHHPVYDSAARALEYEARLTADETRKPQRLSHRKVRADLPQKLQETAVFFDNLSLKL